MYIAWILNDELDIFDSSYMDAHSASFYVLLVKLTAVSSTNKKICIRSDEKRFVIIDSPSDEI